MGIADWLGLGTSIAKPIKAVSELYTTDKARLAAESKLTEADAKFEEIKQKPQLAQLENNKILSMSSNLFNSGGLALLCWTSGFLVLCYYLPQIAISTYVWGKASIAAGRCAPFPMKPDDIMNLVYVIYGYGIHHLVRKKIDS